MLPNYLAFLKLNGKSLSETDLGSNETALSAEDALKAIQLLEESSIPILGGDVLSIRSGNIAYAYQIWGEEYIYLNWYCEKLENESNVIYSQRSYEVARKAIDEAVKTSKKLNENCLIVLVV